MYKVTRIKILDKTWNFQAKYADFEKKKLYEGSEFWIGQRGKLQGISFRV